MNFVDPIHDRKKIAKLKNLLREQKRFREMLLPLVGISAILPTSFYDKLNDGFFISEK